jgi:Domain of unknown function (DUF4189)
MKSTRHRSRNTLLAALTAGAGLAGAFGAAAPAQAAPDMFIALSYSFQSNISGIAVTNDSEQSRINSLLNCQDKGGNHCVTFAIEGNTCVALAILGQQEWNTATGATPKDAQDQALAQNPGSHIAVSGCTSGNPRRPLDRLPLVPITQAR